MGSNFSLVVQQTYHQSTIQIITCNKIISLDIVKTLNSILLNRWLSPCSQLSHERPLKDFNMEGWGAVRPQSNMPA